MKKIPTLCGDFFHLLAKDYILKGYFLKRNFGPSPYEEGHCPGIGRKVGAREINALLAG
jgi:hypothetical protein